MARRSNPQTNDREEASVGGRAGGLSVCAPSNDTIDSTFFFFFREKRVIEGRSEVCFLSSLSTTAAAAVCVMIIKWLFWCAAAKLWNQPLFVRLGGEQAGRQAAASPLVASFFFIRVTTLISIVRSGVSSFCYFPEYIHRREGKRKEEERKEENFEKLLHHIRLSVIVLCVYIYSNNKKYRIREDAHHHAWLALRRHRSNTYVHKNLA